MVARDAMQKNMAYKNFKDEWALFDGIDCARKALRGSVFASEYTIDIDRLKKYAPKGTTKACKDQGV